MKYLMKDMNGLYNKDGEMLNGKDCLSTYDLILKYGFNITEITNKQNLLNKVLISNDISTTTIKYSNQESYIIINKDCDHYDNISFDNDILALVSNDGKRWRVNITDDYYLEEDFNINLITLKESKMTADELSEFIRIRKFIDKYAKPVNIISNNKFIKYIFLKLNAGEKLSKVNTKIELTNDNLKKDDKIQINYNSNSIKITNNKGTLINTLNVKLNLSDYIKNTISEF